MSHTFMDDTKQGYPSYDDRRISNRILYETRQAQLDALFCLTGEVMLNEYQLTTDAHESAA